MRAAFALSLSLLLTAALAFGADEARLMRYPDYADGMIVFTYQNDLWVVSGEGGLARRLTVFDGVEEMARFSPDGQWIAFNGQYNGDTNVYIIPSLGGEPRQLTFHPEDNSVVEWSPDGGRILFTSRRSSPVRFFDHFFEVGIEGGAPVELPVDQAGSASYSPDGSRLVLNRHGYRYWWWKRYRGSANTDVWLLERAGGEFEQLTDWEGNDSWPMWGADGKVYFVSEREGVANIYALDLETSEIARITGHETDGVQWPAIGSNREKIVYEWGGRLWLLDIASGVSSEVNVQILADHNRPMFEWINPFDDYFVDATISPSGVRVAVEARGEIFSLPAENGETRNLTNSSGARDRDPAWSPDGRTIAYVSDAGGEYEVYTIDQMGTGEPARRTDSGGFKFGLFWSPDSQKLLFNTHDHDMVLLDLEGNEDAESGRGASIGTLERIAGSRYGSIDDYAWSPDSDWIAYVEPLPNGYSRVMLYSLESGEATPVTGGDARESHVAFDPEGNYLYWLSHGRAWGGSRYSITPQTTVMAVGLVPEEAEPFVADEDEEPVAGEEGEDRAAESDEEGGGTAVELAGMAARVRRLPIDPGEYYSLAATASHLFYIERAPDAGFRPGGKLVAWSFADRETATVLPSVTSFEVNARGNKILYYDGRGIGIIPAGAPAKPGQGKVSTAAVRMRLDRRAEWRQIYAEAWRMIRDWFYDEDYHGVDWGAIGDFYAELLPHVATRQGLSLLLSELVGELNASHQGARGNPDVEDVPTVNVALLGAELEPDFEAGYYRFTTIYRGDNTEPRFRSPLDAEYVEIEEGDYLLRIDGRDVVADDNYLRHLVGRDNGHITLTTNSEPTLEGAIETRIRPLTDESPLRYKRWLDGNRELVERAGGGRIGYVHLPDMVFSGLAIFNRAFREFRYKDGLIIDCRFNGGGGIDPILIDMLERRAYQVTRTRHYDAAMRPSDGFYGHVVVLINEHSYSDAEVFPAAFQTRGLGTVIGIPTLGFVIAVGPYRLVDNGVVRRTTTGLWDVEGSQLESRGALPDITVRNMPRETYEGRDAQLDAAIEHLLGLIEEHPVPRPEDYPQPIEPR